MESRLQPIFLLPAGLVTGEDLAQGRIYPSLARIREVSVKIATAVAREAVRAGLADLPVPADQVEQAVLQSLFHPVYRSCV